MATPAMIPASMAVDRGLCLAGSGIGPDAGAVAAVLESMGDGVMPIVMTVVSVDVPTTVGMLMPAMDIADIMESIDVYDAKLEL